MATVKTTDIQPLAVGEELAVIEGALGRVIIALVTDHRPAGVDDLAAARLLVSKAIRELG